MTYRLSALFIILLLAFNNTYAKESLPDTSVYQFDSTWRNQDGQSINLTELQGKIHVVAFVYTYCEHTCPIIIARIKSILNELSDKAKSDTVVTLVTLDPERDTTERVQQYMKEKSLDSQGWQVLVGTPDDVLTLSTLFNVRYKPMGQSDIAHSNVITVVDQNGIIAHQLKGLKQSTQSTIEIIEKLSAQ